MKNNDEFFKQLDEEIKNAKGDPVSLKWHQAIFQNFRQKVLDLNDSFPYDSRKCVSDCGGKCCCNNSVQLSTYDIYQIVTSPIAIQLGLGDTTKLFEGTKPRLFHYIDPNSGIPRARIFNTEISEDLSVCPFLGTTKMARSKRDLINLRKGLHWKIPNLYAKNGTPARLCVLQTVKPTICRSSPIGRLQEGGRDGEPPRDYYFLQPPLENCVCVKTAKRVKLRDFLTQSKVNEYYQANTELNEILDKLGPPHDPSPPSLREVLLIVLYDFDFPPVLHGLDPVKVRPTYNALLTTAAQLIDHWEHDPEKVGKILRAFHLDLGEEVVYQDDIKGYLADYITEFGTITKNFWLP